MAEGRDFHQDVIATRFEVDLGVDRSAHEVATVAAHKIILFPFFLQAEFEDKAVLTSQSSEISSIELCRLGILFR